MIGLPENFKKGLPENYKNKLNKTKQNTECENSLTYVAACN